MITIHSKTKKVPIKKEEQNEREMRETKRQKEQQNQHTLCRSLPSLPAYHISLSHSACNNSRKLIMQSRPTSLQCCNRYGLFHAEAQNGFAAQPTKCALFPVVVLEKCAASFKSSVLFWASFFLKLLTFRKTNQGTFVFLISECQAFCQRRVCFLIIVFVSLN